MLYQLALTFENVDEILNCEIQMRLLSTAFLWYCLSCFRTFESVHDETLMSAAELREGTPKNSMYTK